VSRLPHATPQPELCYQIQGKVRTQTCSRRDSSNSAVSSCCVGALRIRTMPFDIHILPVACYLMLDWRGSHMHPPGRSLPRIKNRKGCFGILRYCRTPSAGASVFKGYLWCMSTWYLLLRVSSTSNPRLHDRRKWAHHQQLDSNPQKVRPAGKAAVCERLHQPKIKAYERLRHKESFKMSGHLIVSTAVGGRRSTENGSNGH